MRARGYGIALAGFGVLMAGGLALGAWLTAGPARLPAGTVELATGDAVRLVLVGNPGEDSPSARQVREAARDACTQQPCDAVVLLGDLVLPDGPVDVDDPRLDERIASWTEVAPSVLLVAGDRDRGPTMDPRRLGTLVRWARSQPSVHMPAPTWSSTAGSLQLLALDSTEWLAGGPAAEAQRDWMQGTLRASSASWTLALVHDVGVAETAGLCGRVRMVLHAGTDRSWVERCGTAWVSSGTGSAAGAMSSPQGRTVFSDPTPGVVILDFKGGESMITPLGSDGRPGLVARRTVQGAVLLPDGTVLITPGPN